MKAALLLCCLLSGSAAAASAQWSTQVTGTTAEFRGLDAVDSMVVWAGGRGGVYARTTDGGLTWSSGKVAAADSLFFIDVHGVDARTAYLLGTDFRGGESRIYKTTDGGRTWAEQYRRTGEGVFFDGFDFWDASHGVAFSDPVGGALLIISTDDGGATWRETPAANLPPVLPGEAGFAASGGAIVVGAGGRAWLVTGGGAHARVWRSTDGGRHWQASTTPLEAGESRGLFAVAFRDSLHGIAVGGDHRARAVASTNILATADGGVTWKLLSGSQPAGVRYGVALVPGTQTVVAVGPSGSGVSADGGRSWETIDTIPYNTVDFVSTRHGWAAGTDGRIARWQTAATAARRVSYAVSFPNADQHEAEISVIFAGIASGSELEVRMSRTSPGRYALHEFAKNVYNVRAADGAGRELAITRPDPHQWNVRGHDGTVQFTYTLFADHADGTYSGIDVSHAHLNAPATFAFARGFDHAPVTVQIQPPAGADWQVATQLVPGAGPFHFAAPHMQYLMDSPIEVSAFTLREARVPGPNGDQTIRVALHHTGTAADADTFFSKTRRIVAEQAAVFGELPEFDFGTYTFLADYLPWVFGDAMEHRNSTYLVGRTPIAESPSSNIGSMSHEFFHAWNIERIRPAALEPFDFEEANMSGALWFGEGFTNYYGRLTIKRAGLQTLDDYVATLTRPVNAVLTAPGRELFSPVEMSMQAPFVDAAVSIDATNRQNTFISYYTYGEALGLGLDLTLRTRFGTTLDEYMRRMWEEFGRHQRNQTPLRPYTIDDLERQLAIVARDSAFAAGFFRRHIHGTEALDYGELLAQAGLLLRKAAPGTTILTYAEMAFAGGAVRLATNPLRGDPLYEAGLGSGSRIVSINGRALRSAGDTAAARDGLRPGAVVQVAYEQRGISGVAPVRLQEDARLEVVTYEAAELPVTAAMRQLRSEWLSSKAAARN